MSNVAPPRLVYIIRHAEKPNGSDGSVGIDVEGDPDPHSLVPRGWQRSGALGVLFAAGVDALVTPDRLICPDYGATTPAHRTYQTLLGLAGLAGRSIESPFPEGSEGALAAAVSAYSGVALICWEHHHIPDIAAGLRTNVAPPSEWPGDRFDLIWQFHAHDPGPADLRVRGAHATRPGRKSPGGESRLTRRSGKVGLDRPADPPDAVPRNRSDAEIHMAGVLGPETPAR